VSIKKKIKSLF